MIAEGRFSTAIWRLSTKKVSPDDTNMRGAVPNVRSDVRKCVTLVAEEVVRGEGREKADIDGSCGDSCSRSEARDVQGIDNMTFHAKTIRRCVDWLRKSWRS